MQFNGLANQAAQLFLGCTRRNATRQVRNVSGQVRAGVLNHDRVPSHDPPPSNFPPSLLAHARERPRRNGVTGLAGDGVPPGLRRVLILVVAAHRFDPHPTVGSEPSQYLADCPFLMLCPLSGRVND